MEFELKGHLANYSHIELPFNLKNLYFSQHIIIYGTLYLVYLSFRDKIVNTNSKTEILLVDKVHLNSFLCGNQLHL